MTTNLKLNPQTEAPPAEKSEQAGEHPLLTLRQEVDRLFDNFFSGFTMGPFGRRRFDIEPLRRVESLIPGWDLAWPKMDVVESDKTYRVGIELPGMDEKDVDITIDDGVLTIQGEKREEKKEEKEDYRLTERHFGAIKRSFRLPETVDQDKIDAAFEKGVLTVTLPKTGKPRQDVRKVAIKGR